MFMPAQISGKHCTTTKRTTHFEKSAANVSSLIIFFLLSLTQRLLQSLCTKSRYADLSFSCKKMHSAQSLSSKISVHSPAVPGEQSLMLVHRLRTRSFRTGDIDVIR